jgi:signal transduction histidine kinase
MSRRDEAVSWRAAVLQSMLNALAIVAPAILIFGLALRTPPLFDRSFMLVTSAVTGIVALRFARGIPFRPRAVLAVGMLIGACLCWMAFSGFSIGATAGMVGGIVMAAMLLDRTTALALLLATALSLVGIGFAIHVGLWQVRLEDADPRLLVVWLRMAISFALLTGALTTAVAYIVRHVETKYVELSAAYDELAELNRKLETAKEEERRFIARELHDDLGQALTVLKLGLKTGKATPFSDPVRIVDGLINKVRELSRVLRPALLDEVGLAPALGAYLEEQSNVSGITMDLKLNGLKDERLSGELEIACFRLVQEAVTNALRHAGATRVNVRIDRENGSVRLSVKDDGNGRASADEVVRAGLAGHLGVIGMRERTRALGGTFELSSEPGRGTTIEVELPLGRASAG